jgi:hypothetical protein
MYWIPMVITFSVALATVVSTSFASAVSHNRTRVEERQNSMPKMVFAQFVVSPQANPCCWDLTRAQIGTVSDRSSAADYDADMLRAKAIGIDAFALGKIHILS